MVKQFHFARLPLIFFGNGKLTGLPEIIERYGRKVILVTGQKSFINSQQADYLYDAFRKHSIVYSHSVISGEPSPEMVDKEVKKLGNDLFDSVLAIGGGSVIDAGKAISAMMYKNESIVDYLEGVGTKEHSGIKIPFIAVPTTSGTGSEATKNAVISRTGKGGFKKSLRHENFVPDVTVIDPLLTLNCPPTITAASGMDCFTQLTEAFLSDKSCEYTDALAWEGLKAVRSSLLRCFLHGEDPDARADMSFAALTSGICLANAGLGVVHGFASSIGGMYDIPHGIICGTLMASANEITVRVLRHNSENCQTLEKYVRLGKLFLDENNGSDDFYIDGFIHYLHELTSILKLPGLKQFGITQNDIPEICRDTENKNNPAKLNPDDLAEILQLRL